MAAAEMVLEPKKAFSRLLTPSPDVLHGGCMNGFLAICCIRREIMS
jgi:hypothetical protein